MESRKRPRICHQIHGSNCSVKTRFPFRLGVLADLDRPCEVDLTDDSDADVEARRRHSIYLSIKVRQS